MRGDRDTMALRTADTRNDAGARLNLVRVLRYTYPGQRRAGQMGHFAD